MAAQANGSDFYLRFYVGHKGKFGHEFLEFEFRPDGQVRLHPPAPSDPPPFPASRADIMLALRTCTRGAMTTCVLRAASICQQLAVQERHDDPEGGLLQPCGA